MSGAHVGVLTTSYPRHADDPAGRFVYELCGWLAGQGDCVEVLAPHPARSTQPGVRVRPLRYAARPRLLYGAGAPDNLRRHPAAWAQIPALVGRMALSCRRLSRRWDRVLSHWLIPCGVLAARCARRLPHLAIAHSSEVTLLPRLPLASGLLAALARPRTELVLTSEGLRPPLLDVARTPAARRLVEAAPVIRMGIEEARLAPRDPDAAARLRRRHGLEHRRVVLCVGRLVPVKGIDVLIRALGALQRHDVVLVVVGEGPQRRSLEALARGLRLETRFTGELGPGPRDAWLHAADLFVLPSRVLADGRRDSAPVALLEAMAAGLPVVASRSGGNAEIVTEQLGLLVPPDRVEDLSAALSRLLDDATLRARLGTAARGAAADHTWRRVGAELRRRLQSL